MRVDPANFQATVDNPYLPLVPGTRYRYRGVGDDGPETVTVEVTGQIKRILGVPTVSVRDTVTRRGELVEDTVDWYAQDHEGNVWYFGEDTKAYEDGKVTSTSGSWQAGRDGAEPGVLMKARPRVGDRYRQEHYAGHAEDMAEILSVTERTTVPFGSFRQVVQTREFTPLERDVEFKYYARGVGLLREITVIGGNERLELVDVSRAATPESRDRSHRSRSSATP